MKRSAFKMKGYSYPGSSPMKKDVDMKHLANVDISKLDEDEKKRYYAKVKDVTGSDVVKHKGKEN